MNRRRLDILVGVLILGLLVAFLYKAVDIRAPAQVYPLTVIVITLALACAALLRGMLALSSADERTPVVPQHALRFVAAAMFALCAYAVAFSWSFLAATFIFLAGMYYFLAERRDVRTLVISLLLAGVITALVYFAFGIWLQVPLAA